MAAVVIALAVWLAPRASAAAPSQPGQPDETVTLYTIGAGSYLFSLYGHSVLCVGDRCFDYGIATHTDPLALVWHALRGVPDFVPVRVRRDVVLAAFSDEDRVIDAQDIPLDDAARQKLLARLEREVSARVGYSYSPWFDNCTTHLRDALDEASDGRLARVASLEPAHTFRQLSEAGFSGRPLPLLGIALAVGGGERVGTPFERMFLPSGLSAGVASAFGAAPQRLHDRTAVALPTSVHAGRTLLLFIAVVLALGTFALARRGPRARMASVTIACSVLACAGLLVWALALVARYPEVSANWNLLVVVPFDLALPWLSPARARSYVIARLGVVALVAVLSLVGVIAQPLIVTALFAALPLAAVLRASNARTATAA